MVTAVLGVGREVSEDRCQDPSRSRILETGKTGLGPEGPEWARGVIPARAPNGGCKPKPPKIPSSRRARGNLPGSVIDQLSQTPYAREEAGTQRYSVGTDTPK